MTDELRKNLDAAVLNAVIVRAGSPRITFGSVLADINVVNMRRAIALKCPGTDDTRLVDRSLQRLRRAGKLAFHSKTGWKHVRQLVEET